MQKKGNADSSIDEIDLELGEQSSASSQESPFLAQFHTRIANLKTTVNEINAATSQLDEKYNEYLATVKNPKKLKRTIGSLCNFF